MLSNPSVAVDLAANRLMTLQSPADTLPGLSLTGMRFGLLALSMSRFQLMVLRSQASQQEQESQAKVAQKVERNLTFYTTVVRRMLSAER
jgi:hypothetical protein